MVNSRQVKKIKCPHCGWIRSVPIDAIEDVSTATVVRDWSDELRKLGARFKDMLQDVQLDDANAWIDMPKCPNCGNVYQYNVGTGERRE